MKIFTCRGFEGFWPVETSAVVIAELETEAANKLNEELRKIGLPGDAAAEDMIELPFVEGVRILQDGNY